MKETIKISRVVQYIIIGIAFIAILSIWPLKVWHEKNVSNVSQETYITTSPVSAEENVMQEFIPAHSHVDSIRILIDSLGSSDGSFSFHLYDKNLTLLWEANRDFSSDTRVTLFEFCINMELYQGEPYYYTIDYVNTPFAVCFTEKNNEIEQDNGKLYYALEEISGCMAITEYEYTANMSIQKNMYLIVFIIILSLFLILMTEIATKKLNFIKEVKKDTVIHFILSTAIAFATIGAIVCVWPLRLFSNSLIDNMVYLIGISGASFSLFYATFKLKTIEIVQWIKSLQFSVVRIMQSLLVCLAMLACVQFVNAGSNYAQGLATYKVCIFLGLFLLAEQLTFVLTHKIYRIVLFIYCILLTIGAYAYLLPLRGQGETYITALNLTIMWVIWLVTIPVTLVGAIRNRVAYSIPHVSLLILFFLFLILFRRNNIWELVVTIPFGFINLKKRNKDEMDTFLSSISNGVILSFITLTYQSLHYRPFHYYLYIRYPGMFTTVTVTSVYLALVFAVAIHKLFASFQKSQKLKDSWKELILVGMVSGYQFLTLSRTGILTCFFVFIVAIIMTGFFNKKIRINLIKLTVAVVLIIALYIPVTFAITRIIPAVVNEPLVYETEQFSETITKGEGLNSYRYITVERFLGLSSERILGKPDLSHVTESGKTIEEVLDELPDSQEASLEENGVQVGEEGITYIDNYGTEYTIETKEYSNGRIEIFREYLKNLNFEGHDAVGLVLEDGSSIIHAHNSFIQMAYDCGIQTGGIFLLFYFVFGIRSVQFFVSRKTEKNNYLPMLIIAAFGISSMVEYVFRPTIPLGLIYLFVIAPLVTNQKEYDRLRKNDQNN